MVYSSSDWLVVAASAMQDELTKSEWKGRVATPLGSQAVYKNV